MVALALRRRRSYGSPHRARMAQGQSSKGTLRPGQRPGCKCGGYIRPERAKAFETKAFALTGRVYLGVHIPRAVPWADCLLAFQAVVKETHHYYYVD